MHGAVRLRAAQELAMSVELDSLCDGLQTKQKGYHLHHQHFYPFRRLGEENSPCIPWQREHVKKKNHAALKLLPLYCISKGRALGEMVPLRLLPNPASHTQLNKKDRNVDYSSQVQGSDRGPVTQTFNLKQHKYTTVPVYANSNLVHAAHQGMSNKTKTTMNQLQINLCFCLF